MCAGKISDSVYRYDFSRVWNGKLLLFSLVDLNLDFKFYTFNRRKRDEYEIFFL